jgi:hypothetical protein
LLPNTNKQVGKYITSNSRNSRTRSRNRREVQQRRCYDHRFKTRLIVQITVAATVITHHFHDVTTIIKVEWVKAGWEPRPLIILVIRRFLR